MSINIRAFAKDATLGISSSVVSQIIALVSIPIITHLYTPEDLGVWQICLSTILILLAISTLRLESTLILASTKTLTSNVMSLISLNSIVVVTLTILSITLFEDAISAFLRLDGYPAIIWIVPIGLVMYIIQLVFSTLLVKQKKFAVLAKIKIISVITISLSAIVPTFFFNGSAYSYSIAGLLGIATQILLSIQHVNFKSLLENKKTTYIHLYATLRKYRVYPQYMLPFALSQSLIWQTTLITLGSLYSLSAVGGYVLANKLMQMPVSMITESVKQVLFAHGVRNDPQNTRKLIEKLLVEIIYISVPLAVLAFFFITNIINYILGSGWELVGEFSRWLLFSSMPMLLTAWLGRIFEIQGRQKTAVLLQVSHDIGLFILLYFLFLTKTQELNAIIYISIYTGIYNLIWLKVLLNIIGSTTTFFYSLLSRLFFMVLGSSALIAMLNSIFNLELSFAISSIILLIYITLKMKNTWRNISKT